MGIKINKRLFELYKLDELIKKGDCVEVPFKILTGEQKFRSYCSIYGSRNGFTLNISKKDNYFKVERIN